MSCGTGDTIVTLRRPNGLIENAKIQDFVDDCFRKESGKPSSASVEECSAPSPGVEVLDIGPDARFSWLRVVGVRRSSPSYEVRLSSGRTLVSEAGFLQRDTNNKIQRVSGGDLTVGSYLAVPRFLDVPQCATAISLHSFLNKKQFLFADDAIRAWAYTTPWDTDTKGLPFTVPFANSEQFRARYTSKLSSLIQPGCVYANPETITSHFPDKLQYTPDLGRAMGSYLARGVVQQYEVLIPRMNSIHTESVKAVCAALCIGSRVDSGYLRLLNDVLPSAFTGMLGNGAARRVPDELVVAPKDFLAGFLDGYCSFTASAMCGGAVSIACANQATASSLQRLLLRFAIRATVQPDSHAIVVRSGTDFLQAVPLMRTDLAQTITALASEQPQGGGRQAGAPSPPAADFIPNVNTKSYGLLKTVRRSALGLMIKTAPSPDKELFEAITHEDVAYEKIISIANLPQVVGYSLELSARSPPG